MRRSLAIALAIFLVAAIWLLAAPVPVDPVAWQAPEDQGLTGAFSENDLLHNLRITDLGEHRGPEDAAIGRDGYLYATSEDGAVLRISPSGQTVTTFANTGGRPLGIEATADGRFYVANPYVGVQRIDSDGSVSRVSTGANGAIPSYLNDIAVARDGTLYVSDSSAKFSPREFGGTLAASLLDVLEHGGHGSVLRITPNGRITTIMDGLNFANGVALSRDETFLLIAETASYRILKHWLQGPHAGTTEILIDNLPGFPDNINNGMQDRYWVGLIAPRNALIDRYSDKPWARKIVQRLPKFLRPQPEASTHVISIDGNGDVLMSLQDPQHRHPQITGAVESRESLYFTTLEGRVLPRIAKQDLFR